MTKILALIGITLLILLALPNPQVQSQGQLSDLKFRRVKTAIPGHYIIILHDDIPGPGVRPIAGDLLRLQRGRIKHLYKHAVKGFSAYMTEAAAIAVSQDPRVKYVEQDGVVSIDAVQFSPPWGLDRIDQRGLPLDNRYTYRGTGAGVNAYIIDTGIKPTHDEFEGRASVGYDAFNENGLDCHGHGTHVAGVVGGETYGAAKKVKLYAVRVLDCSGQGTFSGVIAGVDWVTANHIKPAVANMSLGAPANESLDTAVRNSIRAGVTYVVPAGNQGVDAGERSPARVGEAITVGATDIYDYRAWFSNYGSALDLFAPGVDILSAWIESDTGLIYQSGTSVAAPYVAGTAALYLETNPAASAGIVQQALKSNATYGKVRDAGQGSPNRLLFSNFPCQVINAVVDKPVLWPPNHRMVELTVNYNTAGGCRLATCALSVTSNEPVNGTGDGDTSPDWRILDSNRLRLRAERAANGTGRVYTIAVACKDDDQRSSRQLVKVSVPKSIGR